MKDFFAGLGELWVSAAAARGGEISAPTLDPEVIDELLELARVAAHTQERKFAPLVSFTAGVAAERLRVARPEISGGELAAYVEAVRRRLEDASRS